MRIVTHFNDHAHTNKYTVHIIYATESRFLSSTGSHIYHLRVYVYQARNLTSMDKDSFSGKILLAGQKYD